MIELGPNGAWPLKQGCIDAINDTLPKTAEQLQALLNEMFIRQGIPPALATAQVHREPPGRERYSLEELQPETAEEERLMLDILFLAISSPTNSLPGHVRTVIREKLEERIGRLRETAYPCKRFLFYGT